MNGNAPFQTVAVLALLLCLAIPVRAEYLTSGDQVTDSATGLTWMRTDDGTARTWEEALAWCEGLSLGEHDDWRLPNVNELFSLTDFSSSSPAINPTFQCQSDYYWSGSSSVDDPSTAWAVSFSSGRVGPGTAKDSAHYVRCVRGGP